MKYVLLNYYLNMYFYTILYITKLLLAGLYYIIIIFYGNILLINLQIPRMSLNQLVLSQPQKDFTKLSYKFSIIVFLNSPSLFKNVYRVSGTRNSTIIVIIIFYSSFHCELFTFSLFGS